MKNINRWFLRFLIIMSMLLGIHEGVFGIDSDVTRETLAKIRGVRIVVEDLQPNFKKYANRFNINQEQILKAVENKLRQSGMVVLNYNDWLKTPGRPILYISINTHENEKYWYAYDIKLELIQVVSLETDPALKTMATTWSVNMTGVMNIGNLNTINHNVLALTDRFIKAYQLVAHKKK